VYAAALLPALAFGTVEVPAGTVFEVRQISKIGTRHSHTGDRINATLITPLIRDGRTLIPAGTPIEGEIASLTKVGLGFRHQTASMVLRFHTVRLPDGQVLPIEAKLGRVNNAKEWVDADGRIHGIRPNTNVSSSLAVAAWRLLMIAPMVAAPVWATKIVFAPAPDTEIQFPVGTEYRLQLATTVHLEPALLANLPARVLQEGSDSQPRAVVDSLSSQRVQRKSGKPSDLINLILIGSARQLQSAFEAAGWSGSVPKSTGSVVRSYISIVARRGYPNAPMGTMMLDGAPSGMEFQKNLNSFARRHHLRIWKRPQQAGDSDVWVAAATEDIGIHYSSHVRGFTHFIDENVDNERTKIMDDLFFTGCVEEAGLLDRQNLPAHMDDGGGKYLRTDGKIGFLRLNDCLSPRNMPGAGPGQPGRASAIRRFGSSVRNELVRSNFVSLAYNATRLGTAKNFFSAKATGASKAAVLTRQQSDWLRPMSDASDLSCTEDYLLIGAVLDNASAVLPYR
jgi:hypothetical protein